MLFGIGLILVGVLSLVGVVIGVRYIERVIQRWLDPQPKVESIEQGYRRVEVPPTFSIQGRCSDLEWFKKNYRDLLK